VTDFFDGFLARKMQLQSSFGRCLDPIADKLLVIVTLVMVINFSNENKWILISALVIICREIIISGLREFLATINVDLPVSRIGKWKTAIQMLSIGALLLSGKGYYYAYNEVMTFFEADDFITVSLENVIQLIGEFGIFVSAILTIISAFFYVKYSLKFLFTNE
jgi:cardiolipin synthase